MVLFGITKDNIHQGLLEKFVRNLFLGEEVLINARKEAKICHPTTGSYLELDLWVPKYKICFEFQDPYHYITTWDSQVPLAQIQEIDEYKRKTVQEKGHTIIEVPCWWDGSEESLVANVRFYRPDLLCDYHKKVLEIPINPPTDYFTLGGIPDVGELMRASFPLNSNFSLSSISPSSFWWLGEKYDGIRFCYHPGTKSIYARTGYNIEVQSYFLDNMPNLFLDGEIWFGRGEFVSSQRLIHAESEGINWPYMRMLVFDSPDPGKNHFVFEDRYETLLDVDINHPYITLGMRLACTHKKQLNNVSQFIIKGGGEGVILRKPKSVYERGRSASLLKLKAARADKEALVVADGGLLLQLTDGSVFEVDRKNIHVEEKLKKGDVVTFTYDSIARLSTPVNPKIVRVRTDVSWRELVLEHASGRDVVKSSSSSSSSSSSPSSSSSSTVVNNLPNIVSANVVAPDFNTSSHRAAKFTTKPMGYWTAEKGKNRRKFFENFAAEEGFDPLVGENWYKYTQADLKNYKGIRSVLHPYQGSLMKALFHLFPEAKIDLLKFDMLPKDHFKDFRNRRKFFMQYARSKGFDPLVPQNWYSTTRKATLALSRSSAVLKFYPNFVEAILHLFPEIGLEEDKFIFRPARLHMMRDPNNRRKVLQSFAADNKFDPLVAENWYHIPREQFMKYPKLGRVLKFHNMSFIRALQSLFPDVDFDPAKFGYVPVNYWKSIENKRNFFIDYAESKGFDPFEPENWYAETLGKMLGFKGAVPIVKQYSTIGKALIDIFPEMQFDANNFNNPLIWRYKRNREFLIKYAKERGLDPFQATTWSTITKKELIITKAGASIVGQYGSRYDRVVNHLLPETKGEIAR